MATGKGRIESLDALRGFAIFGILLINIQVFSGYGFVGPEGTSALSWGQYDGSIRVILDVLVRAKFYSLFSLLFGYSFVMMARKAVNGAAALHLRRMAGLLVIGVAHSLLLWPWDILVLYALMGLLLTPFLHRRPLTLAAWGLMVLVIIGVLTGFGPILGLPDGRGALATRVLQENVSTLAGGSYQEVLHANLMLTGSISVEWLQGLRPLRVFGMFLIGAAAAALGLAGTDTARKTLVLIIAITGLVLGLALSLLHNNLDPETELKRVAWVVADTGSAPVLAIGYAAALILWWNSAGLIAAGVRKALAPVGRMALTNYLLQSAICVPLFYGFGAGWFAEFSLGRLMVFSGALFAVQMIFSAVWLSLFRQGPIEWLWRWQIKGRKPALLTIGRKS